MSVLTILEAEIKRKNEAFLKLVKKNPTLPIVPMVDAEIVADDCGRWMGALGSAYVGEYVCYDDRFFEEREDFKERYYDNNCDELCEMFDYEPCMNFNSGKYTYKDIEVNKENEKRLNAYLDEKAEENFIKAIILHIDLPE